MPTALVQYSSYQGWRQVSWLLIEIVACIFCILLRILSILSCSLETTPARLHACTSALLVLSCLVLGLGFGVRPPRRPKTCDNARMYVPCAQPLARVTQISHTAPPVSSRNNEQCEDALRTEVFYDPGAHGVDLETLLHRTPPPSVINGLMASPFWGRHNTSDIKPTTQSPRNEFDQTPTRTLYFFYGQPIHNTLGRFCCADDWIK